MINLEDEIAFAIWSAQTGNASRAWWSERMTDGGRDQYVRAAKMVVRRLMELNALKLGGCNVGTH